MNTIAHSTSAFVFALLLAGIALSIPAQAQMAVSGRIVDTSDIPVAYANAVLLASSDSSLVMGTVTDGDGQFVFKNVVPGTYLVYASMMGYTPFLSEVFMMINHGDKVFENIILVPEVIELDGVVVEARRTLYEHKADRIIMNLRNGITTSGSTALDVLEQSPGVIVDRHGNGISIFGKDGVQLMINGKLSYIPEGNLVQYLSGLNADNIGSIELITSPPADMDAEGNAGFININLFRQLDDGIAGTWSVSGGYGDGETGGAGADVQYRRGRLGVYASYSYYRMGQTQYYSNFRRLNLLSGITETPTESFRNPTLNNHDVRIGLDYQLGSKTSVGLLLSGYSHRFTMDAMNTTSVMTDQVPTLSLQSANDELHHFRNAMGSLNLTHKPTETGTLSVDLDYLYYHDNNPVVYYNTLFDLVTGSITNDRMESGKKTPLSIVVTRADYNWSLNGKWKLGVGVKGAFSRFTNEATFVNQVEDAWVARAGLGSQSELTEDVVAAYGKADVDVNEDIKISVGLRYELTDSNLGSDTEQNLVDRRFGGLFPSLAYQHKINPSNQVNASFSRRINRPAFTDLAPFLYFFDPYTFFTGNTALQPAISNTVKLDVIHKSLFISAQYAWEDNSIAAYQSRVIAESNVQIGFPANMRRTQSATALVARPVQVASWWNSQNNVMLLWQQVDGYLNDEPVALERTTYQVSSTQNISLPYGFSLEVTGYYRSAALWGAKRIAPMWNVDTGLQKVLPNNRGTLAFSITDGFNSAQYDLTMGLPDDPCYVKQLLDISRRTFQLTYSRRFGGKMKNTRARASEEESQRVSN